MYKLFAIAATVLALSACDSTVGPTEMEPELTPPAFVGTWTLEAYRLDIAITSTIDQTVALRPRDGRGTGGIEVTGDPSGTLFRPSIGILLDSPPPARPYLEVTSDTLADGDIVELAFHTSTVSLSRRGFRYEGEVAAGDEPFLFQAGQLIVPERPLASATGETVTVGGTLTFPTAPLRAGEEAIVPAFLGGQSFVPGRPFLNTFVFRADGTFEAATNDFRVDTLRGTWTETAADEVTATYELEGQPWEKVFDITAEDGGLQIVERLGPFVDDDGSIAAQYFAQRGSFESLSTLQVYTVRPAAE